jgi:hypothetical protein
MCLFGDVTSQPVSISGLPVVIFPGNVGGEHTLAEIVKKWRPIIPMSMCCVEDGSNLALWCGVVSCSLGM